jgi:hypothetical protein
MAESPRPPVVAWKCCARCSGDLLIEPQMLPSEGSGAYVYCKPCKKIVDAEIAARPCVKGARCVHVDYQRGPFADLVVREVDGDRVKVMVLGHPDGVPAGACAFHHTIGREWYTRGELIMKGM